MKIRYSRCSLAAWAILAAGFALPAIAADAPRVVADETREFDVLVKGKPAGTSTLRITDTNDGTTRVVNEVHVKLSFVVYTYRYDFRAQETWHKGRFVSADNSVTDGGKKFTARITLDRAGSVMEANGLARRGPVVDMTTNYWRAPDLSQRARFSLVNADRGSVHAVTVTQIALERMALGQQELDCTHYRVAGELEADLWFDRHGRIVRQKTVEDGYPTELVLKHVDSAPLRTARR